MAGLESDAMSSVSDFCGFNVAGYLLGSLSHTISAKTGIAKDLPWLPSQSISIINFSNLYRFLRGQSHVKFIHLYCNFFTAGDQHCGSWWWLYVVFSFWDVCCWTWICRGKSWAILLWERSVINDCSVLCACVVLYSCFVVYVVCWLRTALFSSSVSAVAVSLFIGTWMLLLHHLKGRWHAKIKIFLKISFMF